MIESICSKIDHLPPPLYMSGLLLSPSLTKPLSSVMPPPGFGTTAVPIIDRRRGAAEAILNQLNVTERCGIHSGNSHLNSTGAAIIDAQLQACGIRVSA